MQSFQPGNRLLPGSNSVKAQRNPNMGIDTLALLQTTDYNRLAKNMEKIRTKGNKRMVSDAEDQTKALQNNRQLFDKKAQSVKQEMEQIQLQEELS